ncbi:MAG: PEP-utilizing enzyme, partial [Candidatus Eremiobacterota bacterium]
PITALPEPAPVVVWDNSNIIESYSGVTTPLTFSFALSVYEHVYRQFCQVMGVEESLLERNRPVFARMLGLIRGRIYYNLLNWYRVLALLPGFSFNREFMERMMGVREKLPDVDLPAPPRTGKAQDLWRLLRMAARMRSAHARLPEQIRAFHARVEAVLARYPTDLRGLSPGELLATYRRLEEDLLMHWKAPLVNDFFAMMAHGLLNRLVERWLPGEATTLGNDLMCGEGGMISTEPAAALARLSHLDFESPAFREACREYLERFGDRSVGELKLETETLRENPEALLALARSYREAGVSLDPGRGRELRRAAEARVVARLSGIKRSAFFAVLREARRGVRDRENLRFERTRVFALVRRIFLALGSHLARRGALEAERDVFYLTCEEVFGYFEGAGVTADLKALVELRRAEFAVYREEPAPPDRFETLGPPGRAPFSRVPGPGSREGLRGLGCCPGVVRAPVRVVRDPARAGDLRGCILVTERTDPGWVVLFATVSGLAVERGSMLSHSAIVAREMGIPCVVGVAGLMEALRDGETVELDGSAGTVKRVC